MRDFLKKLQKQPEHIRKLILWTIVVIIALILGVWWFCGSYQKIKKFETEKFMEELNLPENEQRTKNNN